MPCEGTAADPCVTALSEPDVAFIGGGLVLIVLLLVALLVRGLR